MNVCQKVDFKKFEHAFIKHSEYGRKIKKAIGRRTLEKFFKSKWYSIQYATIREVKSQERDLSLKEVRKIYMIMAYRMLTAFVRHNRTEYETELRHDALRVEIGFTSRYEEERRKSTAVAKLLIGIQRNTCEGTWWLNLTLPEYCKVQKHNEEGRLKKLKKRRSFFCEKVKFAVIKDALSTALDM